MRADDRDRDREHHQPGRAKQQHARHHGFAYVHRDTTPAISVLHITNGDSAAERIRAAGLGDNVLPWRDVLHEGPVPPPATLDSLRPLRVRFLAGQGWGNPVEMAREFESRDRALGAAAAEQVVLWFEHDLYDQLQLAQILDWYAGGGIGEPARPALIQADDYLGPMAPSMLAALFDARTEVSAAQLAAARVAWRAFSSPDPRAIEQVRPELSALPFMAAALTRQLQEFPSVSNGLSRVEQQTLEALASGPLSVKQLFAAAHAACEDVVYLGDAVFVRLLSPLAGGRSALVRVDGDLQGWPWSSTVEITDAGRAVLEGRADRIKALGIDRWLGGVHLRGHSVPWRWDTEAQRIVPT